jgi:hypothetical protein
MNSMQIDEAPYITRHAGFKPYELVTQSHVLEVGTGDIRIRVTPCERTMEVNLF